MDLEWYAVGMEEANTKTYKDNSKTKLLDNTKTNLEVYTKTNEANDTAVY